MTDKERILVVDDERLNLKMLGELLKPEYTVILANSGPQALERAARVPPSLVLLDIVMPGMDGFHVLKRLKNHRATREIPVIFITALTGGEDEEKGLLLGAVDYIAKPFQPAVVLARIRIHMKILRQRRLLESIALLDGLTEIPNNRSFTERMALEWKRAHRTGAPLSLGVLDLDYFKEYNDTYGHGRGDEALKTVAALLDRELKRRTDFAARYGGEEFVLLMPETDAKGALMKAEMIRAALEALRIEHAGSPASGWLTVSIGGATMRPPTLETERQLFESADRMLYEAKKKGRNRSRWREDAS